MNIYDESTSENGENHELDMLLDEIDNDHQEFFDKEWDKFNKTPNEIIESEKTDLGLIELYTPHPLHEKDPYIVNSYMYVNSIALFGFMEKYDYYVKTQLTHYKEHQNNMLHVMNNIQHPYIRNYQNICLKYEPAVEIVKRVYYKQHTLAILKTCWLRIFQKKFKNRQKKKLSYKCNINNLRYRELHGKWHSDFYQI
jgi:hypothetical protein